MKRLKKFLALLGPGFITGASDDDPSGIATYAQTGAQFGYSQLWTALFTIPFMIVIQEISARIADVTGKGLAGVIRDHYAKTWLYLSIFILLIANVFNIGADLGAMAASAQLLVPIPFASWLFLITAVTLLLEVLIPYKTYAKYLKYLALTLVAYIITAFVIKQDWSTIWRATFIPTIHWSKEYILNIAALLGTTISPYLFFWQADEEIEEARVHHELKAIRTKKQTVIDKMIKLMRLDTAIGMVLSNIVTFFIIITTASTLGAHHMVNIATADQAAEALRPLGGQFTFLLFALGVIGTGLLAVPVLAGSASYALSEAFGLKSGLYKKFAQAHGFYGIITFATLVGIVLNFSHIQPFTLLYYAAILNGIAAPIVMVIILRIANNRSIMGKHANSSLSNYLGWIITAIMALIAVALIVVLLKH